MLTDGHGLCALLMPLHSEVTVVILDRPRHEDLIRHE